MSQFLSQNLKTEKCLCPRLFFHLKYRIVILFKQVSEDLGELKVQLTELMFHSVSTSSSPDYPWLQTTPCLQTNACLAFLAYVNFVCFSFWGKVPTGLKDLYYFTILVCNCVLFPLRSPTLIHHISFVPFIIRPCSKSTWAKHQTLLSLSLSSGSVPFTFSHLTSLPETPNYITIRNALDVMCTGTSYSCSQSCVFWTKQTNKSLPLEC